MPIACTWSSRALGLPSFTVRHDSRSGTASLTITGPFKRWPAGLDRTECLCKAARARLELHEVPTKLPGALDRDRGQRFGRPLLAIRVSPRAHRRPVGHPHLDRRPYPFPACHLIEFKLDPVSDIATIPERLRAAAEAKPMRLPLSRR